MNEKQSKATITKPWSVALFDDGGFEVVSKLDSGEDFVLATRYPHSAHAEQLHEAGRLFAASPELLEALQALLEEVEDDIPTCPLTRDAARAAITKATQGA